MSQKRSNLSSIRGSTVLVTGGNGAVGCNLVRRLLELSCNIVVLDDFSQSKKGNLPLDKNIKIIRGDIADEKTLNKTFATRYDYIFHLAARFANEMSVLNPIEDLRVNIQGTLQLLLHAAKQKTTRFLYSSSSSLYGPQKENVFAETLRPNPSTPYAVSKLSAEYYCNAISELYGLEYSIVRLSNSYGPFDHPGKFRNVIPNFFQSAIHGRDIIITGTGKETRDFTYIDDTIKGILLAATHKNATNEIFNLGTGKEIQIKKIVDIILHLTGNKSKIVYKPRRSFDHIVRRRMDVSKAKRLLGYNPQTTIHDGLEKTYQWFSNR